MLPSHRMAAVLVGLLACATACRDAPTPTLVRVREIRRPMGTYMAITVYAPDEAAGTRALAAAFARVEQVEAAISTWRRTSDASRLNREAGGQPVPIAPELAALLKRAAAVSAETDGAFDVTIGALVRLCRRTWRRRRVPTPEELSEAMARVGHRHVELSPDGKQARLAKAGMRLDFGAIGKGYIVDQAVGSLRRSGIQIALVDAGGDIYAMGAPPERAGWTIGVRDPDRPTEMQILKHRLLVRDCAVATSGDYEQFVVIDGHRYSHIVDPRTGQPVEHMSSVTVVAPDATTADAYATACSVLGPQAAVAFAEERKGVEALVLHRRDGDALARARSSGFDRFVLTEPAATGSDRDKP
ncbi:MAG: FAD:protein FMN transferase [Candidatus Brocadiae bacterium]|nr:FAD:protein FMN transferase [Candidatus Brocadiia bacterium]